MLAKALANECDMNFISINCQDLLSMPLNNTKDHLRSTFYKAQQIAPCILLIDKFDYLCKIKKKKTKMIIIIRLNS